MKWTANLAYAVGLLTTDGCLSKDGRHIDLTSKDIEQIHNFMSLLDISTNKIGLKKSSRTSENIYYRIQFSNVKLYRFLVKIGLMPNKTKIIGELKIPDKYFSDFLRGHLDGDGSIYTYWDKRWKSSFMIYIRFCSASKEHLFWMRDQIKKLYNLEGNLKDKYSGVFALEFAKYSSIKLFDIIYYKDKLICLSRKRSKMIDALDIISKQAGVAE